MTPVRGHQNISTPTDLIRGPDLEHGRALMCTIDSGYPANTPEWLWATYFKMYNHGQHIKGPYIRHNSINLFTPEMKINLNASQHSWQAVSFGGSCSGRHIRLYWAIGRDYIFGYESLYCQGANVTAVSMIILTRRHNAGSCQVAKLSLEEDAVFISIFIYRNNTFAST